MGGDRDLANRSAAAAITATAATTPGGGRSPYSSTFVGVVVGGRARGSLIEPECGDSVLPELGVASLIWGFGEDVGGSEGENWEWIQLWMGMFASREFPPAAAVS